MKLKFMTGNNFIYEKKLKSVLKKHILKIPEETNLKILDDA
jgi:hypothetical protein